MNHAPLDGFSDEQRAYLQKLISDLDLTTVFKPAETSEQPLTVHGTPLEDLSKEENAKFVEHPWDLWPKLRQVAHAKTMPEGTDVFMLKHHGLFNVQPVQSGFMTRLRIPACRMRGDQLVGLGDLSESLAGGYAHVTTRGNLQMREIAPGHILMLLQSLFDLGLTSKGAGADSVRNITCTPTAGFDPDELIDLSPVALDLHHYILNTPELHGIPRKFNIAFDGGGRISAVADTNDIGFLATEVRASSSPEGSSSLEPGIYCRILLGGITGHQDFAGDTGLVCRPDQAVEVSVAMLKVFIANGDRTNRKKARLKYLLDRWGVEKFCEETQKLLDFELLPCPIEACEPRYPIDRQAHIGVHPQREADRSYIGVALPMGRMSAEQLRGLGQIAMTYGGNDVRLTVWQNILLPNIHAHDVDDVVGRIRALGLDTSASSFATGVVGCTGKTGCKYAAAHTKEDGLGLVGHLQSRFELDQPINIHLTGCAHSCAQHYIGDIGLVGASVGEGEDAEEAYQVYLGGGCDHDQGLAVYLTGPVPVRVLPTFVEHLIQVYLNHRESEESFLSFCRRHDESTLKEVFLAGTPASLEEVA